MPGGRPKSVIPPCRHCSKQFRRQEHLLRHERTHTNEKPFGCKCGQSFTRQDLLARHTKLSHYSSSYISPQSSEVAQTTYDYPGMALDEPDIFWDPHFLSQDMLPSMVFDSSFQFDSAPLSIEKSRLCNLSQFSSRLPCLEETEDNTDQLEESPKAAEPWSISESCYTRLCHELEGFSAVLIPGCSLPSRSNLIRYLEKYLVCGQEYLPFIHVATFSVNTADVELLLAMAALGALYLFERARTYECYFMARAIVLERTRREDLQLASDFLSGLDNTITMEPRGLCKIQTLTLLISLSPWADKRIVRDAAFLSSQLATQVRESGISEPDEMPQDIDWLTWVAAETKRRTIFGAYVAINLQTIAFDTPPLIMNHEVKLFLPGYAKQWKASNAAEWQQAARQNERSFQEGLHSLFMGTGISGDIAVSSFSNYLLIHGILQQIYIDRHGIMGTLQPETTKSFEAALRNWQSSFERGDEPFLDPLIPKDAVGLMGAALLRLAYTRLNSDFVSSKFLLSRDLNITMGATSTLNRSQGLDKAVLHAAHGLSIPVRLGTPFMARTKTPIWSIEHSLCSLECALLLKHWLEMMSQTTRDFGVDDLSKVESKLLGIITSIVKESNLAETLDIFEDDSSRYQRMAETVVKLWAEIFQGAHVHDIDNTISAALQLLADTTSLA
ncbi:hypothetical protein L207DRAFT_490347 [Hyaloscypha variabilis F]|uniref:C2H2-type domain-containing protein n=1 Tax=Hyaloscypha variabilis (strain UAMH 11265 / GT02V1 / F) TaxID=1149755 RepID=A0A2J6RJK0_HYAVF|nr:hypothetical protein L207DRAFT_490347 [Hyaloscypha variabilis F]